MVLTVILFLTWLLTGFTLLAVRIFSSSADGTNRKTRERKSTSCEFNFLFKYISIVLVNFKTGKKNQTKKALQNNSKLYTSRPMTTGKEACNRDLNAVFCLLKSRSQTEVATTRARKQAVHI